VIAAVIALVVGAVGITGYFALRPAQHGTVTATTTSSQSPQFELSGNWIGTYTCLQGLTKLDLVMTQNSATAIEAVFNFFADPTNPSVPSGSFAMVGTFDAATSAVSLNATQWINQPSGYRTVDLRGTLSKDRRTISGQVVLAGGCSTFTVRRSFIEQ
jgi:hypothetical protein